MRNSTRSLSIQVYWSDTYQDWLVWWSLQSLEGAVTATGRQHTGVTTALEAVDADLLIRRLVLALEELLPH